MNEWWLGLPPAEVEIACGEDEHRLRWEAGELRALDHDDAEAERTLTALGGHRCACVDLLDAWARHAEDLRVLLLASRGPTDTLRAQPDTAGAHGLGFAIPTFARRAGPARARRSGIAGSGWASYAVSPAAVTSGGASDPHARENELIELLSLGGGLQDRLVATVAAGWARRLGESDDDGLALARAQLHAALYGRVVATVRGWLAQDDLQVELRWIGESDASSLSRDGGLVRVEVPFSWLSKVWAKGLAVVCGRFCLAAATSDGKNWALSTISPDLSTRQPITLELTSLD